jgi:uncharacterized protein YaiI (UPF0178 family)
MHIWVDADACPGVIKDILFRAAVQTGGPATLDHTDRKRFADQLDRFLSRAGY